MENSTPQKKGLGPLAWVGIGCGGIVVLGIIGFVIFGMMFGGKIKQFAEDAQKNPAKATASLMVSASAGQIEMVAEDDENKRYTVKEKQGGKQTTFYWDAKKNSLGQVDGDFSSIPADSAPDSAPVPVPDSPPVPAPK